MEADLEQTTTTPINDVAALPPLPPPPPDNNDNDDFVDDSNCSTPYVSAPSSPGRTTFISSGFFYSAPTSPMHYVTARASSGLAHATSDASSNGSFEFEFSSRFDSPVSPEIGASMSSADELFLNGQIRPMKLCAHLSRPQHFPPFPLTETDHEEDDEVENEDVFVRSRDARLRDRSQRRRTRSMSPLRSTTPFDWLSSLEDPPKCSEEREKISGKETEAEAETTAAACGSASSSRCSSAGRSSKRWVFLKDFLRSKSEGRSNNKFWHNISFSPAKDKEKKLNTTSFLESQKLRKSAKEVSSSAAKKEGKTTAAAKRRSAHEMHYAANRAQAEEMRKKTFLPYRQGLLGCLGFDSKSYGALNGFARALNPVSSR